jgi:hypothetical protein
MESATDTRTPEEHRAALHRIVDVASDQQVASLLAFLEVCPAFRDNVQHRAGVEPEG